MKAMSKREQLGYKMKEKLEYLRDNHNVCVFDFHISQYSMHFCSTDIAPLEKLIANANLEVVEIVADEDDAELCPQLELGQKYFCIHV